jgi:hypothetical protein
MPVRSQPGEQPLGAETRHFDGRSVMTALSPDQLRIFTFTGGPVYSSTWGHRLVVANLKGTRARREA